MTFSERYGYKTPKESLQLEQIDDELKIDIFNVFHQIYLDIPNDAPRFRRLKYAVYLWRDFFKKPFDEGPFYLPSKVLNDSLLLEMVKNYLFDKDRVWYECFDFIEFVLHLSSLKDFERNHQHLNYVLERGRAGWRFVEGKLVPITSKEEIENIEDALSTTQNEYRPVNEHLKTSLILLSNKPQPDFRNSIKESISSVEALCKILTGNNKATLGQALNSLENKWKLHPALSEAFKKLYGYTNDEGGIRHAMIDGNKEVDLNDAKFMLVTCSAFINYVVGKLN